MPGSLLAKCSPVPGRSVPFCCVTRYCSWDSFEMASGSLLYGFIASPSSPRESPQVAAFLHFSRPCAERLIQRRRIRVALCLHLHTIQRGLQFLALRIEQRQLTDAAQCIATARNLAALLCGTPGFVAGLQF